MKAVTWHGNHDVRVDTHPDPTIQEPTDAIVRVTSTGICGSDLHLYEVLGAFIDEGDILGHEPMGIVEAVGSEVEHIAPGDRVVVPFNVSCGRCFMCEHQLMSQCETTQVRDYGTGASLLGYTKLYGQVPGGQAELLRVPQAHFGPIKVPEGPPDDRFVYLSDVLPTAWQAVEYADVPDGGSLLVLGLGPIGEMCCRVAQHRGVEQVLAIDLVPDRLERARGHGVDAIDLDTDDLAATVRERTGGRGPDSVIDAVGMEAHGSPIGRLAHRLAGLLPDKLGAEGGADRGHRPARRAAHGDRPRPPRRHALAVGRLRRGRQPDAADPDVRQADHDPDGPGQRPALGRRSHAAGRRRRRPAGPRDVRDAPGATDRRAARVRDLPEEAGRRLQDPAPTLTAPGTRVRRVDVIDSLVANNRAFAASLPEQHLDVRPRRRLAIVTCMDSRLDVFAALGLQQGEAHVLRNAGGVITDDVIRSLAVSQRRLGTREVMLVHHTDCGMLSLSDDGFRAELQEATGVAPAFAIESFSDLDADVRQSVLRVRRSPFLLHTGQVRGFVYDVDTHALREVAVE